MPLFTFHAAHINGEPEPSHKHLTWLDLSQPPPLWPEPRLTARINKVEETLESIKWKIDVRRQMVALADNNGAYCSNCSHNCAATSLESCGTSCALRRPKPGSFIARSSKRDTTWLRLAKRDMACYDKMIHDIDHCDHLAPRHMVVEWEVHSKNLLAATEDPKVPTRTTRPVSGLNRHWIFAGRWGQGPGLEPELAPDETETSAPAQREV